VNSQINREKSERKKPKKQSVGLYFWQYSNCILSAELPKTHSYRLFFFGNFAHWVISGSLLMVYPLLDIIWLLKVLV